MAERKSAQDELKEFLRDPENARRFAQSEISLAITALFTQLRKDAKLTQAQLATRVGRQQAYIAKLEGGAYDRCSLPTLRVFARALGYDIDVRQMIRPLAEIASDAGDVRPPSELVPCVKGEAGQRTGAQPAGADEVARQAG